MFFFLCKKRIGYCPLPIGQKIDCWGRFLLVYSACAVNFDLFAKVVSHEAEFWSRNWVSRSRAEGLIILIHPIRYLQDLKQPIRALIRYSELYPGVTPECNSYIKTRAIFSTPSFSLWQLSAIFLKILWEGGGHGPLKITLVGALPLPPGYAHDLEALCVYKEDQGKKRNFLFSSF